MPTPLFFEYLEKAKRHGDEWAKNHYKTEKKETEKSTAIPATDEAPVNGK